MDGKDRENHPSAAKAGPHFAAFTARLKPCPFKTIHNVEFFRSLLDQAVRNLGNQSQ